MYLGWMADFKAAQNCVVAFLSVGSTSLLISYNIKSNAP